MAKDKLTYKVGVEEHSYCIRERDYDDEWDAGEYGMDASLIGIAREGTGHRWEPMNEDWDFAYGADDIAPGDMAHIVFIEYTTGSTFGSEGAWAVAAVKADIEEAAKIRERCEDSNDVPDGEYKFRQWDGYFEHLNSARVESLIVQN